MRDTIILGTCLIVLFTALGFALWAGDTREGRDWEIPSIGCDR